MTTNTEIVEHSVLRLFSPTLSHERMESRRASARINVESFVLTPHVNGFTLVISLDTTDEKNCVEATEVLKDWTSDLSGQRKPHGRHYGHYRWDARIDRHILFNMYPISHDGKSTWTFNGSHATAL